MHAGLVLRQAKHGMKQWQEWTPQLWFQYAPMNPSAQLATRGRNPYIAYKKGHGCMTKTKKAEAGARLPVTADAEGVVLLPAGVLGSVVVTVALADATVL
jgi:hypothetical protein